MKAVVTLSGGMDSTIAFYWAIHNQFITSIDAVTVDYGQTHVDECRAAAEVWVTACSEFENDGDKFKLDELRKIRLPKGIIRGRSSLLGHSPVSTYENVEDAFKANQSDSAYVPARNAVFVTLAANHLLSKATSGMIVTGFRGRLGAGGGFQDGTPEFADAIGHALNIGAGGSGTDPKVVVYDPLNRPGRSRLDALKMAKELPGCWDALAFSMTCFQGTEPPCGKCLPCLRRAEGFEQFGEPDPLIERLMHGQD